MPLQATLEHVRRSDIYQRFLHGPVAESEAFADAKSKEPMHICEGTPSPSFRTEIVIPRCCETVAGELSWISSLARVVDTISVYYKCPWCLPPSMASAWQSEISRSTVLRERVLDHGGTILLDALPANGMRFFCFCSRCCCCSCISLTYLLYVCFVSSHG